MTYIPNNENLQSKVEYYEQRHMVLRTVENCFSRLELQIFPEAGKDYYFIYDSLDRVSSYMSPEGGDEEEVTTFYKYNLDGQQTETQTPDIKRVKYKFQSPNSAQRYTRNQCNCNYDNLTSQLKSINYVAPEGEKTISYKFQSQMSVQRYTRNQCNCNYDNNTDQLIGIELDQDILFYKYDGGLLLSEESSIYSSKLEWVYDDDLRVSEVSDSKASPEIHLKPASLQILINDESENSHTRYRYNNDNQLKQAGQMDYYYDDNGFLTSSILRESNPQHSPVNTYNFNDYGEVTKVKTVIAPTYDYKKEVLASNINQVQHSKPTKLQIYELDYEYDGIGRIKAITETRKPDVNEDAVIERTEYFYDMQGRIEKVESSRASDSAITIEEYSYDGNGNRLTANFDSAQSPIIATYDAQDRMLTYGDNTYTYTVNGALLTKTNSKGVTEYNYDAVGNLLKVKLPDNRVITYQIDARGRRIGKKINGNFQYGFIYGDQLNPIAKVDETGVILERYVYGLKNNIPEYIVKDDKWYKIVSNHLGSPIMIVDFDESTVVKEFKYDTFGNVIEENGDFEIPFRFAGGIYDKDTKLTRFGVRDYDSETGRWTSKEPLGFAGARNFYVYVKNNPVMFRDPTGLILIIVGSQEFQNKVNAMLDQASDISPYIRCVVEHLKNSLITHHIIENDINKLKGSRELKLANIRTSTVIGLENNFTIYYLIHEIWHSYTGDTGTRENSFTIDDIAFIEEANAIDFANILRVYFNKPFDKNDFEVIRKTRSGINLSEYFTKKYKECNCIKDN